MAYDVTGFGMTRGTLRSALGGMKGGGVIYDGGDWRPARAASSGRASTSRTARTPDHVAVPLGRGDHGSAPHETRRVVSLL